MGITKKLSPISLVDLSIFDILFEEDDKEDDMEDMQGYLCIEYLDSFFTFHYMDKFMQMQADPNIEQIVLEFDCLGGDVIGLFEFSAVIENCTKPVYAMCKTYMCSGAYLLACACDDIFVTESAYIGSVGVVATLYKYKEDPQVEVHVIYQGDGKVFGNPDVKLSDSELKYYEENVSKIYEKFVNTVARNRAVSVEEIKKIGALSNHASMMPEFMYDKIIDYPTYKEGLDELIQQKS